jgi:hypothetical protein
MTGSRKQFANIAKSHLTCAKKITMMTHQSSKMIQITMILPSRQYAQMTMTFLLIFNMEAAKPKSVIFSDSTQVRPTCESRITAAGIQSRKLAKNLVELAPVLIIQHMSLFAIIIGRQVVNGSRATTRLNDRRDTVEVARSHHRILH